MFSLGNERPVGLSVGLTERVERLGRAEASGAMKVD